MPILYILCGPSGCGKTTWAFEFVQKPENADVRYVSRDAIRYEMVNPNEEYFSREKEVFRRFANIIRQTLIDGFDVIADATHLNEFSRRKLTQAIDIYFKNYEIIYVSFNVNADVCIKHNANREGRANVPETVIRNMCRDFKAPSLDEDERAKGIIEV